MSFKKYRNPDPQCTYPFEDCGAGYCWSYAHHVDGNPKFSDMSKICPGCECWKPSPVPTAESLVTAEAIQMTTAEPIEPVLKKGDRVRHKGSEANPNFRERIGVGTIVSIFGSRVRVKWDRVEKARNYKAISLERFGAPE